MYAIVDIETTGGSPKREKITEIAIYLHDGEKITGEYTTLVNPEKAIPYFITQLTGITNEMVANAPKFYEIAKDIVKLTENRIFVAHNANFDYSFVQREFEQLGYEFERKKICTIKLCRELLPGKKSYSLGKLCQDLNIQINGRHRAAGDAHATTKLLDYLICLNGRTPETDNLALQKAYDSLHPGLSKESIMNLPEKPGVYYLYNDNKDIIYIGKSINLKKRVVSHFQNKQSKRAMEMKNQIAGVSYELTGNELIAFLLESDEIKKHMPRFNRAQRRTYSHLGLYSQVDGNGYVNFRIEKNSHKETKPITCFDNFSQARNRLVHLIDKYSLCQKLCGLYDSPGACFHFQIGECAGACIGEEDAQHYNLRANQAIDEFKYSTQNCLIIDKGRHIQEKAVVKIENGKYIGFGYFDCENLDNGLEQIHDCVKTYEDNHDAQHIIKRFLNTGKVETIITY